MKHVLAIPGTGDLVHLEANVAAGAILLTHEDLAVLETAAWSWKIRLGAESDAVITKGVPHLRGSACLR